MLINKLLKKSIQYNKVVLNVSYTKCKPHFIKTIKKTKMKVKLIKKDDNKVCFEVEGINAQMANALRRIIISRIPVMAIEKVAVEDAEGVLHIGRQGLRDAL